ncbi:hypothetical protein OTSSIDO_0014 [Orientia tsutsugamushi str. Sido]|nr:hypothetical protein OTSSIDO_0014 [Orientia tsutsugamushi str. Sido]
MNQNLFSAGLEAKGDEYGKIVYDLALRRYLIEIGEKIVTNAYSSTLADLAISQIETAESQLYDLGSRGTLSKGFTKLQTSIEESWASISSAIKNKNSINRSKILQAVQDVYVYEIQELQVTPFEQLKTVSQKQINEEEYLLNLSKQLGSNSTWYKVRESLIKSYGQAIDKEWFSKLEVINEDSVNNKEKLI